MEEIEFDKYMKKGSYHWLEASNDIRKMNAFTRARYDIVLDITQKYLGKRDAFILDAGCGDGALAGLICRKLGGSIYGVDASQEGIELAKSEFMKRGLRGSFFYISSYQYPFSNNYFDVSICSDVIEHVQDPNSLLNELWRVTKSGGMVILTTPIRMTLLPIDPMHVREWFPDEFAQLCEQAFGVTAENKIYTHPTIWADPYMNMDSFPKRLIRIGINLLVLLGCNPFSLEHSRHWRYLMMQTLVFIKP